MTRVNEPDNLVRPLVDGLALKFLLRQEAVRDPEGVTEHLRLSRLRLQHQRSLLADTNPDHATLVAIYEAHVDALEAALAGS